MDIINAIKSRWSCRAFLDKAIEPELIQQLLDTARWCPSGVNTQPWQVVVLTGNSQQQITAALIAAKEAGQSPNPDYDYYPKQWQEPWKSRRKATGLALYGALQISREDTDRQKEAWYNNYRFFGAPYGLLFFIDEQLSTGSWVDMGMFIQTVMLTAQGLGLATCPQASLAEYPDAVRKVLDIPATQKLVAGISLGYADKDHPVNNYRTEREPVDSFCRWYD